MGRSLNDTVRTLQEAFASLQHHALHDSLTGLANRKLLRERLGAALTGADSDKHVAVLFVDLDGFKQINDAHGHDVGDSVLVAVAQRISERVRSVDTVARLGGDEFAVLLTELAHEDDAGVLAQRILHSIQAPLEIGSLCLTPGASVGVAVRGIHTDIDQLIREADTAMYGAKSSGKGAVVVFAGDDATVSGVLDAV
jgi:diguanylate cyclase (GGDEF)-like protein